MKIGHSEAVRILEANLAGHEVHEVIMGENWALRFDNDTWLLAQELFSPEEDGLNALLASADPSVLDGVDPDQVSMAVVVVSFMRCPVCAVSLSEWGDLTLTFDDARSLTARTDVDTVDWQWSVGSSQLDPYRVPFTVASLSRGEFEVPERT